MLESERALILKIVDGCFEVLPIVYQIKSYRDHNKIFKWLFENNITGNNFKEWFYDNMQGSVLTLIKFVNMHKQKEKEFRPIISGIDWL